MKYLKKIHEEYLELLEDRKLLIKIMINYFDSETMQFKKIKTKKSEITSNNIQDHLKEQILQSYIEFQHELLNKKESLKEDYYNN